MKHFLLAFSMISLLATVAIADKKDDQKKTKTLHMTIEGMTCKLCAKTITKKLSKLCESASIDHKNGTGVCVYLPSKTTEQAIVAAVTDAGYTVTEWHVE